MYSLNPVFQDDDEKWYHWHLNFKDRAGPFDTEFEAKAAFVEYYEENTGREWLD